jgi:hypothetical protein
MNRRYGWAIALLVVLLVGAGAVVAYNVGLSQGLAQVASAPTAGTPPPPYVYYGWHRPWAFGFFPLFPLLFIFVWVLVFRSLFWRRWGPWYHGPYPESFDEWHRRAHERMKAEG